MIAALLLAAAPPITADGLTCQIGEARPTPCTLTDRAMPGGRHRMIFTIGARRIQFDGRRQGPWWSGRLDGRPAMGYERNRGYTMLSTGDLTRTFSWWSRGSEHGSY